MKGKNNGWEVQPLFALWRSRLSEVAVDVKFPVVPGVEWVVVDDLGGKVVGAIVSSFPAPVAPINPPPGSGGTRH